MSDQSDTIGAPQTLANAARSPRKRVPVGTKISRGNRVERPEDRRTIRVHFRISPAEKDAALGAHPKVDLNKFARDRLLYRRNRHAPLRKQLNDVGAAIAAFAKQLDAALSGLETQYDPAEITRLKFARGRLRSLQDEVISVREAL
jgi:hypothetical protein